MIVDLGNLDVVNFTVKLVDNIRLPGFILTLFLLLFLLAHVQDIFELLRVAFGLHPLPSTLRRGHVFTLLPEEGVLFLELLGNLAFVRSIHDVLFLRAIILLIVVLITVLVTTILLVFFLRCLLLSPFLHGLLIVIVVILLLIFLFLILSGIILLILFLLVLILRLLRVFAILGELLLVQVLVLTGLLKVLFELLFELGDGLSCDFAHLFLLRVCHFIDSVIEEEKNFEHTVRQRVSVVLKEVLGALGNLSHQLGQIVIHLAVVFVVRGRPALVKDFLKSLPFLVFALFEVALFTLLTI